MWEMYSDRFILNLVVVTGLPLCVMIIMTFSVFFF